MVILPEMGTKVPFDPVKGFVPIGAVGAAPLALVVPASFKPQSLREMIAEAKANPGALTYASTGPGSVTNLGLEMLKQAAGVEITQIAYKGQAAAMPDLIAGRVSMMLDVLTTTKNHVSTGKLRYLAISTKERMTEMPQVPTIAESGYPNVDVTLWFGVWAPAGTPPEVVTRLSEELAAVTTSQVVKDRFAQLDMVPFTLDSNGFANFIRSERSRWGKLIKDANIKAE